MVTHDRYFLDNVAGWILELDRGEGIPWKGNYSSWLEQKLARMATEQKQAEQRLREMGELQQAIVYTGQERIAGWLMSEKLDSPSNTMG